VAILVEQLNPVSVGIDVGQVTDPTALCITECIRRDTGRIRYAREQEMARYSPKGEWIPSKGADPVFVTDYTVRHIERLSLGMSYPDQAAYLADVLCNPLLRQRRVTVRIDVTGVGRPVYESLLGEFNIRKYGRYRPNGTFQPPREMCEAYFLPITFVHGETYNRRTGSLGKSFLVSKLQSLLQSGRVHAPDTPEVRATLDEMRVYERRMSQDGVDQYGAFKKGTHDDLATALGLSCLEDPFLEKARTGARVY
jgi:hypothetical protein